MPTTACPATRSREARHLSLLICTPCYGGMLHKAYFDSCNKLGAVLQSVGVDHDWNTGRNESLIQRARMEMTAKWLFESDYDFMMWIDSDIQFEPDDVAKLWNLAATATVIDRHRVDIAVGVYQMKTLDDKFAAWKDGKLITDLDQFDGPTQVDYAGTGFMMISRRAALGIYDYLKKRHAELKDMLGVHGLREHDPLVREIVDAFAPDYEGPNGRVPALYMCPIHNDTLESEDFHFSRIAREAGFPVIMDPSVRLKHWGQYAFG